MSVHGKAKAVATKRPAEAATSATSLVVAVLAKVLNINDADSIALLALLVGHVPALVTYLVTRFSPSA